MPHVQMQVADSVVKNRKAQKQQVYQHTRHSLLLGEYACIYTRKKESTLSVCITYLLSIVISWLLESPINNIYNIAQVCTSHTSSEKSENK